MQWFPGYRACMSDDFLVLKLCQHLPRVFWSHFLECPASNGFNMSHNGHGISLYSVVMILMGTLHAGGQYNLGHLSLFRRE